MTLHHNPMIFKKSSLSWQITLTVSNLSSDDQHCNLHNDLTCFSAGPLIEYLIVSPRHTGFCFGLQLIVRSGPSSRLYHNITSPLSEAKQSPQCSWISSLSFCFFGSRQPCTTAAFWTLGASLFKSAAFMWIVVSIRLNQPDLLMAIAMELCRLTVEMQESWLFLAFIPLRNLLPAVKDHSFSVLSRELYRDQVWAPEPSKFHFPCLKASQRAIVLVSFFLFAQICSISTKLPGNTRGEDKFAQDQIQGHTSNDLWHTLLPTGNQSVLVYAHSELLIAWCCY